MKVGASARSGLAARVDSCIESAANRLLSDQEQEGHWEGELASSPFATAVASIALHLLDGTLHANRVSKALEWLVYHQNDDGGWGDTDISPSNLPTTIASLAALKFAGECSRMHQPCLNACKYVDRFGGLAGVAKYYESDRTFAGPIGILCGLSGLADWDGVGGLPFEAVLLPSRIVGKIDLPFVSFSLPIIISIGLLQHIKSPSKRLLLKRLRELAVPRAIELLNRLQPSHGGYLESSVCTSLVVIGTVAAGKGNEVDVGKSTGFLVAGQRADGSWPIVTNLSIWNTTLAMRALSEAGLDLSGAALRGAAQWLILQFRENTDVFTGRNACGWTWTHLDSGMIDADDTSNAILALARLGMSPSEKYVRKSVQWLRSLQNPNGGWPTFNRGRGSLVFNKSCIDITCSVVEALLVAGLPANSPEIARAISYVRRMQKKDGSWEPLWFGNEFSGLKSNPFYGAFKALNLLSAMGNSRSSSRKALAWILGNKNRDGGWGVGANGRSSPEETAFALMGLLSQEKMSNGGNQIGTAVTEGIEWLTEHQHPDGLWNRTPVGIYCESMWYHERTYSVAFPLLALARFKRMQR